MPFDVSAFIANIDPGSLAPEAAFEVMVFGPSGIGASPNIDHTYRCMSVSWPGRRLDHIPFTAYGLPREFVTGSQLQSVQCSIISSEDFAEKTYFQRWQDLAAGSYRRRTGYVNGMFDIGYYDNYVGEMEIYQHAATGENVFQCRLLEAYPVEISPMTGNWGSTTFHILNVTFQYYIYRDDPAPLGNTAEE